MLVSQRHIPEDIVSLIIDILSEGLDLLGYDDSDCRPALRACLLVSRSFCHHSRRHLFRFVRLTDSPPRAFFDRAAQLREIMAPQSNPQLGVISYIKIFSAEIFNHPRYTLYKRQGWGLSVVLIALNSLGSHLEEFHFWGSEVEWPKLSLHVQGLFASIIRSPSLSAIRFCGPKNVPPSILTGVACKNLRLSKVTVDGKASYSELSNIPQLKLESFTMDNNFPLQYVSSNGPRIDLSDVSTSPFSCLNKLTLEVDSEDEYRRVLIMLPEVRLSLETLRISLYYQSGSVTPMDMGQFSKLQALLIDYNDYVLTPRFLLDKSPNIRILDAPTPCPSLKYLDLSFRSGYRFKNNPIQFYDAPIWLEIDALLSKPQFASLRRLTINFKMNIFSDYPTRQTRAKFLAVAVPRFRMAFPSLSVSNSIEFIVEIGHCLLD